MSYQVTCACAVILNEDKESQRTLYEGAIIGDDFSGLDKDRVLELVEEGFLADLGKQSKPAVKK